MKRLINTKFRGIFRVVDMMCVSFGDIISSQQIRVGGRTTHRNIPQFSLHLQTQWRFRHGGTILLGSRDIYTPFSDHVDPENWDYSLTDRVDQESSVFDVVSKQISKELQDHRVVKSNMTAYGDILLEFSNGYLLEAFIPASAKEEEWRLIDTPADEHFIFYDLNED